MNPTTYVSSEVFRRTFTGYEIVSHFTAETQVDKNDKYVAFIGKKTGSTNAWIVVYDIPLDAIISETQLVGVHYTNDIDWVSMSQDGEYVVIMYDTNGSGTHQGTKSYDRNLSQVAHLSNNTAHSDLCVDTSGNQVLVHFGQDLAGYDLTMVKLSDGVKTGLWPDGNGNLYGGHISCRNVNRPGWAYVSFYNPPTGTYAAKLENVSIQLNTSNIIQRWGRNNSELAWDGSHYYQQPHGVCSPDGKEILFASAWGIPAEEAKDYGYAFINKN